MARPAPAFRLLLLAVFLCPAANAQTSTPAAPAVTEPPASPKLNRLFAGAPPRYNPPKPASSTPAPPTAGDIPRNGIVRLPTYIVRSDRPIDEDSILTQKGRDAAMAQRYLGPQRGLDRTLNAVTLTGLWKSIPVMGRVPFVPFGSMTYEERAALIYERPEKKRRFNELLSIEQFAQDAEKAAPAKSTK